MSEKPEQLFPDRDATFEAFAAHVSRGKAQTYRDVGLDLVMGQRGGARFQDAFDGRQLINCHCNGGVFNLGHRNPQVLAAVSHALETLDIGNHHLASGYRARLAQRLSATTGDRLSGVVFGVSGGEAIDLAIKLAWARTGRRGVVSASGGYHGHTGLSVAAGDPAYREPFNASQEGFTQVRFDDLRALEAAVSDDVAAVILEPIPATLGMPIPSPDYLEGVQRICRERGALFIVDEVQTGLGRSGKIWCHQLDGLEPDLLVTGKGLSGGIYPISATLMTAEVFSFFDEHPFAHISTFGGAEPGCAAALAVLDIIEAPGFLDRVNALGERFERGLAGASYELRRRGMFMGLKFPVDGAGMPATKMLIENGVFVLYANNDKSVVQLLPPLVISDEEADEIIGVLRRVLG